MPLASMNPDYVIIMDEPIKCLDCGIIFTGNATADRFIKNAFECSECGAIHVFWHNKWYLEDDANDRGRLMEMELKGNY